MSDFSLSLEGGVALDLVIGQRAAKEPLVVAGHGEVLGHELLVVLVQLVAEPLEQRAACRGGESELLSTALPSYLPSLVQ